MIFSHLPGNDRAKRYLERMVEKQLVGHSLLFAGPANVDKSLFAIALAEAVMGTKSHIDLHELRPEGKTGMHSIDSMRRFGDEVTMPPTGAAVKVFVIYDAERMLATSANALLKTFEEPPKRTVIILLSSAPQLLLPTVRSRCRTVFFESEEIERVHDERANPLLDLLTAGRCSLKTLSKGVETVSKALEERRAELEEALSGDILPAGVEELNASQRDQLQKELDGAVSIRMAGEMSTLLQAILGWYRDLQLIHVRGDVNKLWHPTRQEALLQAYQRGCLLPLEKVEEAVRHAKLSFERSTAIKTCLETLFLKIGFVS